MIDERGNKHGRLLVVDHVGSDKHSKALVRCVCECGNELVAIASALRKGNTTSCGCARFGRHIAPKEMCKRGHEFTPENTYIVPKSGTRACKACRTAYHYANPKSYDPVKSAVYRERWNAKNPEYFKHQWLKRTYGLTPGDYTAMLEAQESKCAICLKPLAADKTTHVDHDHETGKIRELLCQTCNHGIGSLQDSIEVTARALAYLRKHKVAPLAQKEAA